MCLLWLLFFLRGLPNLGDCEHQSVPACLFGLELFSSGACEFVELRFAPGVVYIPTRRDPAFLFDAIECGIQRSLLDIQHFVGELANTLNNPITMQFPKRERLEYQHVESSL